MFAKSFIGIVFVGILSFGSAHASLSTFKTFSGKYGVSTSGWGSTTQAGTIVATVPRGAIVTEAYLYTSTAQGFVGVGGTLQGSPLSYMSLGLNGYMEAGRADVTSVVAPIINGGPGGTYSFPITETSAKQDGSALVVVYQLPSLPTSTVAILDGFSAFAGDTATLIFAEPLNPVAPGFFAEMRLGIGYSCCDQASRVTVNGTVITENAGNHDDSADGPNPGSGNLITMGGDNDPFSSLLPTYAEDHERYNLVPFLAAGDTSIQIQTLNPDQSDNIFLAVFYAAGNARSDAPQSTPVPALSPLNLVLMSLALGLLGGLSGLGRKRHR